MKTGLGKLLWASAGTTILALAAIAFVGCRGSFTLVAQDENDFLSTGRTLSFFRAIQVDPRSEDSAGPQFVVADDIDGDGLMDLVTAWNQSQPVQIHFQRRDDNGDMRFETMILAGNIPVVRVAGLGVADFDQDGQSDIAVLIKETGLNEAAGCLKSEAPAVEYYRGLIIVYLAPSNAMEKTQALAWEEEWIGNSYLAGAKGIGGPPEEEGYTSMALGDIDQDGDIDLLTAWNGACSDLPEVLIFSNGGPGAVRDGTWRVEAIPDDDDVAKEPRLTDEGGIGSIRIKDIALGDVDTDGDLDVIATYPVAVSLNVRWYRNPTLDILDAYHPWPQRDWQTGVVGQISPKNGWTDLGGADVIRTGDIDGDGLLDVVVRSTGGRVIQWLKGPGPEATSAETSGGEVRNIPWQVYTLGEYLERIPEGLAIGDLNDDGQLEVIASAQGRLSWFDSQGAPSVYDQWVENLIIDEPLDASGTNAPSTTDPNVQTEEVKAATLINSILVVDLDGDGENDLVVTLDRSGLSGLSNDALVWFRNTR